MRKQTSATPCRAALRLAPLVSGVLVSGVLYRGQRGTYRGDWMGGSAMDDRGHPRVGIAISWFGGGYSTQVVMGAADALAAGGASVVCFGGGIASRGPYDAAGAIYRLIGRSCVDALIIASGTLAPELGEEGLVRFAAQYRDLPIVSLAARIPGATNVLVDGREGLRDVIEHLIDVHGHRRIAFVRGPVANAEAEERYGVYRSVLEARGLSIDPALVAAGNFQLAAGAAAAAAWLARGALPDAIVAANDEMAVGALQLLHSRGRHVPEDVAIVGFDDTDDFAGSTFPSLTTVRQPLYHAGRHAAEILLARLAGLPTPGEVVLSTSAVIRESCGCSARVGLRLQDGAPDPAPSDDGVRERAISALIERSDLPEARVRPWAERLLTALDATLGQAAVDPFLEELERLLRDSAHEGTTIWPSQPVLSLLRGYATAVATSAQARELLIGVWDEARVLVGHAGQRAVAHEKMVGDRRARATVSLNQHLIHATTLEEVSDVFYRVVEQSEIRSGYVCTFEDPEAPAGGAGLICHAGPAGHGHHDPGLPFPAAELLPRAFLPRGPSAMLVQHLEFGGAQRGFLVLEGRIHAGTFQDQLRQELSSALLRVQREKDVLRLHAEERERAKELEQAYGALKDNQKKLLMAEKLAALGRLTAGIAHEMNTPLAAARAAMAEVSSLADEYIASIADPGVTADEHQQIGTEIHRAIALAQSAATKLAGFIQRMKGQTRDIAARTRERFDAVRVIADTVERLSHEARKANATLAFEHDGDAVLLEGAPESLAQVVTNLVVNAIEASTGKGGGEVRVELRTSEAEVELSVVDHGVGIAPDVLGNIFDPLFTTKPFGEATGLGLTVVHDMVARDLDGTIAVQSQVGQGSTFRLRFPACVSPLTP
jgi:DNA-binding LacI/PurR family transcriptional regulator/signal transduction histidine kinase